MYNLWNGQVIYIRTKCKHIASLVKFALRLNSNEEIFSNISQNLLEIFHLVNDFNESKQFTNKILKIIIRPLKPTINCARITAGDMSITHLAKVRNCGFSIEYLSTLIKIYSK